MPRRSFSADFKLEAASLILDQRYSIPEACARTYFLIIEDSKCENENQSFHTNKL